MSTPVSLRMVECFSASAVVCPRAWYLAASDLSLPRVAIVYAQWRFLFPFFL